MFVALLCTHPTKFSVERSFNIDPMFCFIELIVYCCYLYFVPSLCDQTINELARYEVFHFRIMQTIITPRRYTITKVINDMCFVDLLQVTTRDVPWMTGGRRILWLLESITDLAYMIVQFIAAPNLLCITFAETQVPSRCNCRSQ